MLRKFVIGDYGSQFGWDAFVSIVYRTDVKLMNYVGIEMEN